MPTYRVRDPQTGRSVRIRGTSPPSEAEAQQIFETTEANAMLPRESKIGRDGRVLPTKPPRTRRQSVRRRDEQQQRDPLGVVSRFVEDHYRHFNAATLKDAADAYVAHLANGGQMFLSMAGASSTGELGRVLAPMIRAGKISALSVTGANLEEDLFLLVGGDDAKSLPKYHEHTPAHDAALGEAGHPRVTDTTISEDRAMRPVQQAVESVWNRLMSENERAFPHEVLYDVIRSGVLESAYQRDPAMSWLVAASERDLPIWTPGWEDSTLGNVFAADCLEAKYDPAMIKYGVEGMMTLAQWYASTARRHALGYLQLGGGIAGDYAICVVPLLLADLHIDVPKWQYFCQLTDADESMGGYSGALPTEKASWQKLEAETAAFCVKGDFTISFPLLAAIVMGW